MLLPLLLGDDLHRRTARRGDRGHALRAVNAVGAFGQSLCVAFQSAKSRRPSRALCDRDTARSTTRILSRDTRVHAHRPRRRARLHARRHRAPPIAAAKPRASPRRGSGRHRARATGRDDVRDDETHLRRNGVRVEARGARGEGVRRGGGEHLSSRRVTRPVTSHVVCGGRTPSVSMSRDSSVWVHSEGCGAEGARREDGGRRDGRRATVATMD